MIERNVAVVGLGKIGLPLAVHYATRGHRVLGCDINPEVVKLVNNGIEPFPGEDNLDTALSLVVNGGLLQATRDTSEAVRLCRAVIVVVPVAIDSNGLVDFSHMDRAVEAIGAGLQPDTVVCFETTVPVGTTRQRFTPVLEQLSGLKAGADFFVAFSPERVLTGRVFADLRRYPKLVGGIDERSLEVAADLYADLLDFDVRDDLPRANGVWELGTSEAAELAKLAETTYRDVNIALANTFAVFSEKMGIDIRPVIEACNSQSFSHIHDPGVSVGGHCIPIYPHLYLANDSDAVLVREARAVNSAMPGHVVDRLEGLLGNLQGLRVVILGASYRGQVKESAFSGVFAVSRELSSRGALPVVHDPLFDEDELRALGLEPFDPGSGASAAILQADHDEYRRWDQSRIPGIKVFLDGRSWTDPTRWPGVIHVAVGQPTPDTHANHGPTR